MQNIENSCAMLEEDKVTKDRQNRRQERDEIQIAEDRCNHLAKVKGKLEQSLDEAEDALERERKSKGDVEKIKRKVEGDLKLTQETVTSLEHVKANLGQTSMRKEKEVSSMAAKIEDEKTLGMKYARQLKELKGRIDELEEELVVERQHRAKVRSKYF